MAMACLQIRSLRVEFLIGRYPVTDDGRELPVVGS